MLLIFWVAYQCKESYQYLSVTNRNCNNINLVFSKTTLWHSIEFVVRKQPNVLFFLISKNILQGSWSALTINIKRKKNKITSKNIILWTNGCVCDSALFVHPVCFWPAHSYKVLFGFYWPTHWDSVLSLCFTPDAAVAEDKPELNGNQQDNSAVQGNLNAQTIKKKKKKS